MSEDFTQNQSIDSTPAPVSTPVAETPAERSFRQSEVNDIVKNVRHETEEKVKRLYTQQPQYAQQKYGSENSPSQSYQQEQSGPSEQRYRQMAAEEAQRLRDEWVSNAQSKSESDNAQRIVQNFWDKISPGKEKYADFEAVTGNIEYSKFPNVVQLLAEHLDNSADVLYDLGKNRLKMAQLEQLSYMSPNDAIIEAKRLSESIKANDAAGKTRVPNSPLSQLRPSNVGTESGGQPSMSELKRKYKG